MEGLNKVSTTYLHLITSLKGLIIIVIQSTILNGVEVSNGTNILDDTEQLKPGKNKVHCFFLNKESWQILANGSILN